MARAVAHTIANFSGTLAAIFNMHRSPAFVVVWKHQFTSRRKQIVLLMCATYSAERVGYWAKPCHILFAGGRHHRVIRHSHARVRARLFRDVGAVYMRRVLLK
jgi:hypothetical protein